MLLDLLDAELSRRVVSGKVLEWVEIPGVRGRKNSTYNATLLPSVLFMSSSPFKLLVLLLSLLLFYCCCCCSLCCCCHCWFYYFLLLFLLLLLLLLSSSSSVLLSVVVVVVVVVIMRIGKTFTGNQVRRDTVWQPAEVSGRKKPIGEVDLMFIPRWSPPVCC